MDKISKFLKKLPGKEQEALLLVFQQLQRDHRKVPGVKKLQGVKNRYRVRVGDTRIIFEILKKGHVEIRTVARRSDTTYGRL